ncbi:hypothetical protein DPEC_G00126100 [Dallia pectoralis]|uniref:Uncharacterized protein n=1 Tax=Dallia pectoralis TaxID=75939 RepID=A0ACC2GRP1_DALPE|nr:hypothetical protein DPEC_G00126100 [Dallia pectoralis]
MHTKRNLLKRVSRIKPAYRCGHSELRRSQSTTMVLHHCLTYQIDMVQSFPIDYMHQVCLGVTKKLFYLVQRGKRNANLCRTGPRNKQQASAAEVLNPSIFARTLEVWMSLRDGKQMSFASFSSTQGD